eukprot:11048154-Alexandrium_andersonii.AAC.1
MPAGSRTAAVSGRRRRRPCASRPIGLGEEVVTPREGSFGRTGLEPDLPATFDGGAREVQGQRVAGAGA